MASGGSTAGHGRPELAAQPTLVWAAGVRRPEVEEALRLLDGHRAVTGARIIHIDQVDKSLRPVNLVGPQVSHQGESQLPGGVFIFCA